MCAATYSYSVSANGAVTQVVPGGSPVLSPVGSWSGFSNVNGLAIGSGGTVAYAYERSGNNLQNVGSILKYTPDGGFVSIPNSAYSPADNTDALVAGAVNLSNGHFVFGAFGTQSGGSAFFIYDYNPAVSGPDAFRKVGWIRTNANQGNGDIAFDASGNLYVVSSGTGSAGTTIYSVTAANFTAATGGQIVRSATTSRNLSGFTGVNGVAFDSDGTIFLGNGTTVRRYNPATLEQVGGDVTTRLSGSSDLASCNSPVNLTVQKNVVGRANAGDQFTLQVLSGTTVVSSATTTGATPGIQPDQVGPVAVMGGQSYTIKEVGMGSTDLSKYASAYSCTSSDGQPVAGGSGSGTSSTLTMPTTSGASVNCVFTNTPLLANVTINKQMQDLSGQNPTNRQGWTVRSTTAASTGAATQSPGSATQTTGADGNATWTIAFGTASSRATVTVGETMQPNYSFVSGACVITPVSGPPTTVTLAGAGAQSLAGIAPGDNVRCTYTNKPDAARLTLVKQVQNAHGGTLLPNSWTLTAAGGSPTTTVTGVTGSPAVTSVVVPVGSYALSEASNAPSAAGYVAGNWSCTGGIVTDSTVAIAKDANVTCTIVNSDKAGAVSWTKTNQANALLAGSEWTLNGPSGAGAQSVVVTDCIASSAAACAGPDQDPAAGQFSLQNLAWGSYTLTETKAPPGYQIGGEPFRFTVTPQNAGSVQALGARINAQQPGVTIPLTGGLSASGYLLGGGGILAITMMAGVATWAWRRNRRSAG